MISLPDFKSTEHELEYYNIFEEKVDEYKYLFRMVLETIFPNHINNIQIYVLTDSIVSSLNYETNKIFKNRFEEYEDKGDIFTSEKTLKTIIKEIVTEIKNETEFLSSSNLRES
jgi:hypothetical protein